MKNYKFLILIFIIITNSCSKEDEINDLNQTIVDLQANISQLNSQINDYSVQINQLTSQNNILSNQIEDLNGQLSGFEVQVQEYLNQIQILSEENEIFENQNSDLNSQVINLQNQLYEIRSQSAEDGIYFFNKIEILDPPLEGSMWDLPDLIKPSDFTVYSTSSYQGIENRLFYDRSISDFI